MGATWTGLGVNLGLFSAHGTKVEFRFFGEKEIGDVELPEYTDEVGTASSPDARASAAGSMDCCPCAPTRTD
jgi:hypothetical protein